MSAHAHDDKVQTFIKMVDSYQTRSLKGSTNTMILKEISIYERTFLSEPMKNLQNHAISNAGRKQRTEGKIFTRNIQCLVACAMLEL